MLGDVVKGAEGARRHPAGARSDGDKDEAASWRTRNFSHSTICQGTGALNGAAHEASWAKHERAVGHGHPVGVIFVHRRSAQCAVEPDGQGVCRNARSDARPPIARRRRLVDGDAVQLERRYVATSRGP